MKVTVNDLVMVPASSSGDGNNRVPYCIYGNAKIMTKIRFPSLRVLKRLAREYLQCEFEQHFLGKDGVFFHFVIDGGIKSEKRAAFLAAVVENSSISA